ncbi:MAG: Pr6Pr family membrane protein [Cyclobacteriaceae bacterium]|nr:Pr6Pr family membrane protein [Cyclobacteriaceae bacterium]
MNGRKLVVWIGFITGTFAVSLQLYLILVGASENNLNHFSEIVRFFSFMTIWTNILVTLCFGSLLFSKSTQSSFFTRPATLAATTTYILIVGVVYHLLLANIWNPTGLQYLADILLHTAVPVLFIIFWIFYAEKIKLSYHYAILWLSYPATYFIYSLMRGSITDQYPYPFVEVPALGYPTVLLNSLGILVAYALFGVLTIFVSRTMAKN